MLIKKYFKTISSNKILIIIHDNILLDIDKKDFFWKV